MFNAVIVTKCSSLSVVRAEREKCNPQPHGARPDLGMGVSLKVLTRVCSLAASLLTSTSFAQEPIVGDYWAHDPSTMIRSGDRYYVYRTSQGIMAKWSTNKVNWTYGGQVFPSGPPAWTTSAVPGFTGFFWAPDIAFFNGKYHLYYSCSSWGSQVSAIGLVTTTSLNPANWVDQGPVITSTNGLAYNCIDPGVLVDTTGDVWMVFGSWWTGIYLMQLDPATGLRISPNSPLTHLANNNRVEIEASTLFKRNGFYYLFLNHGTCCSGVDSTYHIVVGRSTSVTGPYLDRNGVNMLNRGGSVVAESTGRFVGPGHAGIMSENGTDWFTYHYYDANNANVGEATLGLARLRWTSDGWPVVSNDWSAFYTFEADAREHLQQFNGQLMGTAAVVPEPDRGGVLALNGISDYVDLPLAVANAGTFAAWVKWNGGGTWQRIFDFGDGTSRYLFLCPRANSGNLRFAITTSGGGNEQLIDGPRALPTNSWTHVAVTVEPGRGVLYVNGSPVATNNSMTLRPWQVQARDNFIGDSQWAADPFFNGRIDSLRIFGRALTPGEIRDLAWTPPSLAHRHSFATDGSDTMGTAHGSLMGNATVTNNALLLTGTAGGYVNLPGGLVSGCASATLEFWATFGANGAWARVFDFGRSAGSSGADFLLFTPNTGGGVHRFAISTSGGTRDHDAAGTLDGQTVHVSCVIDPASGYTAIYMNGVLESEQTGSLPPLSSVSTALGYLGRSLFSADAWLNATIDEFRIYDGRLTPEQIMANEVAGPDALALPIQLGFMSSPGSLTFTWPDYAVGFVLESNPTIGSESVWTQVAMPALDGPVWRVTIANPTQNLFFRLRR